MMPEKWGRRIQKRAVTAGPEDEARIGVSPAEYNRAFIARSG
jgi:hypothetical protein